MTKSLRKWLCMCFLWVAMPANAQEYAVPQAELPTQTLTITSKDGVKHPFTVEMATTPEQRAIGLMQRTALAPTRGMLFVNEKPTLAVMWMKNTLIPLDMVFIGSQQTIVNIHPNAVPQSLEMIRSGAPVLMTLELRAGTAEALGIKAGDPVQLSAKTE